MENGKRQVRTTGRRSQLPVVSLTEGGRLDLTYRRLSEVDIADKSLELSLFTGAILEKCRFRNVNFDRCDFAGTKFIDCTFDRCSFIPVEVRSCFLKGCEFKSCDIRGSQWTSTQVENTTLDECDFREATIRETVFSSCIIRQCNFYRNSITLDRFSQCSFIQVDLGDCTALFLFFDRCIFSESRFSTECVGYTYGLSEKNLRSSELTYLGKPQPKPENNDLVGALLSNYRERRWFVGVCALELNFRRLSPSLSLRELVSKLEPEAAASKRVDWDELQFLSLILQRLRSEDRLPLVGLWPLFRFIKASYETLRREFPAASDFVSAPELVIARLEKLLDEMIDEIGQFAGVDTRHETWVHMQLRFRKRPHSTIAEVVPRQIMAIYGAKVTDFAIVTARRNSWIEWWQLTLAALAAAQVSLVAVNGIMSQVVKLSKQIRKLSPSVRSKRAVSKRRTKRRTGHVKATHLQAQLTRSQLIASLGDRHSVLVRGATSISDHALDRLDQTIVILLALPDDELLKFEEYSASNLEMIHLRQADSHGRSNKGQ